jgi:hypothetical protein
MNEDYIDDYGTCARTYATFRILHDNLDPDSVSNDLGLQPTEKWKRGITPDLNDRPPATTGGWFLTSKTAVQSRDARRHIDWLLNQMEPGAAVIERLRSAGCKTDIFCYWLSTQGHGGPMLSPGTMARLARLGLELSFDAYALGDEDNYLARSVTTIIEYQSDRHSGEKADTSNDTEDFAESRTVCPVIRVDLADDPEIPLDVKVDVARVYSTPESAWSEARRLNELHAGKGRRYLWKIASLIDVPTEKPLQD